MFVIILRFADKTKAASLIDAHNDWIDRGVADGVFLLVGSLQPSAGGMILAQDASPAAIAARVQDDPFVAHGVVVAEILAVAPGRTDARLAFLKG
ncbi:YciI family protein [Sphingomonas adhaesiva]|uniref:YciI family protein n=1 Tax=Sphingomonas adhaesiva TaxID=28212 RepID=UPI002FFAB7B7